MSADMGSDAPPPGCAIARGAWQACRAIAVIVLLGVGAGIGLLLLRMFGVDV